MTRSKRCGPAGHGARSWSPPAARGRSISRQTPLHVPTSRCTARSCEAGRRDADDHHLDRATQPTAARRHRHVPARPGDGTAPPRPIRRSTSWDSPPEERRSTKGCHCGVVNRARAGVRLLTPWCGRSRPSACRRSPDVVHATSMAGPYGGGSKSAVHSVSMHDLLWREEPGISTSGGIRFHDRRLRS